MAEYIHNFLPNLNLQSSFSGTLRGQTLIGSFTRRLSFQFQPGTHRGAFGTTWQRQTSKCAQPTRTSKARRILVPTFQLKMDCHCHCRKSRKKSVDWNRKKLLRKIISLSQQNAPIVQENIIISRFGNMGRVVQLC